LLATVADVMPIRNINRILAINVLKNFNLNNNFVLSNLFKILKIKKKIELDDLGFIIAPIFNSAGRLDNANQIVELLVTSSKHRIVKILEKIFHLNSKRKKIEKKCLDDLNFNDISKQEGVIFIYEPNISEGIIGIIAAKIKEYFNKPCIIFTNSGKIIKGSARSTSKFNIGEYINKALDMNILLSGGGHNLAAGVSLLKKDLEIFKDYIDKSYKKTNFDLVSNFVSKISLSSINKNFLNNINYLGPFGNKNVNPVFLIQNVKIIRPNLLKNRFFSCFVKSSNKLIKAISFSHINTKVSYEILNSKNDVDLLVKIKENKWNNKSTIELEIVDIIKPANNT
jgi:single-stranded-DNA-specific exonuclease